jgi:phage terminase large subunit-like protein
MSDNLPDFLNDNAGVVGASVGLGLQRQLKGLHAQVEKAEKDRKKALERERRRKDELDQDKNIVFRVSKDLGAVETCQVPEQALKELHGLKLLLSQRKITPASFDNFEDKDFTQQVFDRLEACEAKFASQAVGKERGRRRDAIYEIVDNLDILGGMEPSAIVYLRIEEQIEGFKRILPNINAFSSSDDKELVKATEQKLLTERDRVFESLSSDTMASLQGLKSWLQLNGVLEGLLSRGQQIMELKQTSLEYSPPAKELSAWEMATKHAAIICSGVAITALAVFTIVSAVVGLAHSPPNQFWIWAAAISGAAAIVVAVTFNPLKHLSAKLLEQRLSNEARTRAITDVNQQLTELEEEQSMALEIVGELEGISEETRNYLMLADFGGEEGRHFKTSAELYIDELRSSLCIESRLLSVLVGASRIS